MVPSIKIALPLREGRNQLRYQSESTELIDNSALKQ